MCLRCDSKLGQFRTAHMLLAELTPHDCTKCWAGNFSEVIVATGVCIALCGEIPNAYLSPEEVPEEVWADLSTHFVTAAAKVDELRKKYHSDKPEVRTHHNGTNGPPFNPPRIRNSSDS